MTFPCHSRALTFEPLLVDEAREAVRGDWIEACEGPRARLWPARVARCASRTAQADLSNGLLRQTSVLRAEPADQGHHIVQLI